MVFETLNEWLTANQLPLNFNKTNNIHFATKKNMSIILKIGFNNSPTKSSYTKFLGLMMDCTLSWSNHIDLLLKKLSMACYIIRNVKTYVCLGIKNNVSYFFSLGYELWNYILRKTVTKFHNF